MFSDGAESAYLLQLCSKNVILKMLLNTDLVWIIKRKVKFQVEFISSEEVEKL